MAVSNVLYSSASDLWETPQDFFDRLNDEFHFTLDACAIQENAKCADFISPSEDALKQPWNGRVWCNPPYGRQIGRWIEKAQQEIHQNEKCEIVVMLLHARTDTKWFHGFLYKKPNVELRFVPGRLKFGGEQNKRSVPVNGSYFTKGMNEMSNAIIFGMIAVFILLGASVVWIVQNWDDVCDGWENRHDNIRRLAAWHKRRALRRWYKVLNLIGGFETIYK